MLSKLHIIQEKPSIIPIKENSFTSMKVESPKGEYSLKQSFFDPSKSSPPNDFLIKLQMRLSKYNNTNYLNENDESFDNE
jgi:hypothetical protein